MARLTKAERQLQAGMFNNLDVTSIWAPQEGPQLAATLCPVRMILFGGSRGGGKSLPLSAKVLTPKGWSTMGDMRVGSTITNPANGGSQIVVGVYPQGEMDIYEVLFDDGAKAWCTLDHLWAYKCANRPRPGSKKSGQREWLQFEHDVEYSSGRFDGFKVGTTKDLVMEVGTKTSPRIPLTAPVLYSVNGRSGKNGVDPYLLGLLFGDGTFSNGQRGHMVTTGDQEIADILAGHGFEPSGDVVCANGVHRSWYLPKSHFLSAKLSSWASNHGLIGAVGKEKVVPAYILTADVEFRVGFLQGLLDSDGYVDDRGHIEFSNISDSIIFAVRDLVRSLGGKATVSDLIVGTYKNSSGETVECQEYRRVYIWLPYPSMAFRLKRKSARCVKGWNGGHENMRKIVSIEFSHREEAQCIKVSSVYGLFVTDDYVVTHNTDCAIGKQVYGALRYGHNWNGLFIRKSYKYFADIRRRLNQLIRAGLPAELVGPQQGTNYLRFGNGANITLTVVESIDKAEFFQGQSFCVAEDTLIRMADGTGRPIQDIVVGDYVATLEGPRRVNFVMSKRLDDCVAALTEMGVQIHPLRHPIFSASGWKSYSSVLDSCSRGAELSIPESSAPVVVIENAILVPHIPDQAALNMASSSGRRVLSGSCLQGRRRIQNSSRNPSSSRRRTVLRKGLFRSLPDLSMVRSCGASACGHADVPSVGQVQGFRCGCRPCRDCSGGHAHRRRVRGQDSLPFQGGAAGRCRGFSRKPSDGLGNTHRHNQKRLSRYEHPYSGEIREVAVQNFSSACVLTPVGKRFVYDLTVDRANHYISHETGLVNKNTMVSIEEACQFPYIDTMIEMLKGCLRSAAGVPTSMFLTANPGGPGHSQVKSRFMPKGSRPGQVIRDDAGMDMVFIPSRVEDNKILCDNDPEYVNLLRSIKDPALRRAWLEGDWDVVLGGFFGDVWNPFKQVVPSFKPPMHWPRIVGMDWGSATPFSIGWYAVSDGETSISFSTGTSKIFPKGALIRFHEWYGCPKNTMTGRIEANVGLRLQSTDVGQRMIDLESRMPWLTGRSVMLDRVADPSIFAERDGPSIAEKFSDAGVVWRKAENKRISGWDSVRNMLHGRVIKQEWGTDEAGDRVLLSEEREPLLYITDNCEHMIRTLPEQERDMTDMEDIDCFVAGTKIRTPGGTAEIQNVKVGDLVETPLGPRRVIRSFCSGEFGTFSLNFSDGTVLEGTGHHKIMTGSGLLPLCLITPDTTVEKHRGLGLWEQNQYFTEGFGLQDEVVENIGKHILILLKGMDLVQFCSTEMSMSRKSEKYRTDFTSTMLTEMPTITTFQIWNSLLRVIMLDCTMKSALQMVTVSDKAKLLLPGELQKMDGLNFQKMLGLCTKILPKENLRALIVASLLEQNTRQQSCVESAGKREGLQEREMGTCFMSAKFAEKNIRDTESQAKRWDLLAATNVGGSLEDAKLKKVYSLEIEQSRLYYANGVLVSNTTGEDHACLTLDTEVFCNGTVQKIEDIINIGGDTLNLYGDREEFLVCKVTSKEAEIVLIEFDDGESVKCTPDHKFLTDFGWTRCDTLTIGDELRYVDKNNEEVAAWTQLSMEMSRFLKENGIICAENTGSAKVSGCIGQSGPVKMGLCRQDSTFTTKTRIGRTTGLRTSNLLGQENIFRRIAQSQRGPRRLGSAWLKLSSLTQPSGTDLKRAASGTGDNTLRTAKTDSNREKCVLATGVMGDSRLLSGQGMERIDSAQENAKPLGVGRLELITRSEFAQSAVKNSRSTSIPERVPAERHLAELLQDGTHCKKRIVKIKRLGKKEAVACLYVPGSHSFLLASGLISHNCDELRYVCTSRPSMGVLLRDIMRPKALSECERDFLSAQSGASETAVLDGLSLPQSAGSDDFITGVRVHVSR